jgi:hypothetical protein
MIGNPGAATPSVRFADTSPIKGEDKMRRF